MMAIDWAALSRLIPEVAVVALFMLYSERKDRAWRKFLEDERAAHIGVLTNLTTQVAATTTMVGTTNQLLVQHDQWERQIQARRRQADFSAGRDAE